MKRTKNRKISVPQPQIRVSRKFEILTCALLAVAIFAVYSQTFGYGFVSFDDGTYVYQNAVIKTGLTLHNLAWAFTTFYASNWHPLTWISHMIDSELGLDAGAQHAVNVFLHLGSSLLLFFALKRMTGQRWRSALVAGIFAIHPLHVESVAWVAERKDVLCAFFGMLTLWLYARYAQDPKLSRYLLIVAAFALSLLSKPMAVTLPFVLILLDIWPLRRRALLEKIPLLAMSAAVSIVTMVAQRSGAMMSLARLPFPDRVANALVAYLRYLEKAFWPVNLAMLYPIEKPSGALVVAAALILAGITTAAVLTFRRRPYILIGWLWFIGTLVPVIGLVQVGFQSMADRYAYVPLVGLSIALIWTIAGVLESAPRLRRPVAAAIAAALLILTTAAYRQTQYWKDSITLFEHTLAVTRGNAIIHNNLGIDLQSAGRLGEAADQFREAVAAEPDNKDALNSLGAIVAYKGNLEEAIALHRRAVAADPNYAGARINLGHELLETGQTDEASIQLTEGLRLDPASARAHAYLGAVLIARMKFEEAREHLESSLRLAPANSETQSDLCYALEASGHAAQAIKACEAALKMRPNSIDSQLHLGKALAATGQTSAAEAVFSRILAASPNNAGARAGLQNLRPSRGWKIPPRSSDSGK